MANVAACGGVLVASDHASACGSRTAAVGVLVSAGHGDLWEESVGTAG